jgi:hypothetical protein
MPEVGVLGSGEHRSTQPKVLEGLVENPALTADNVKPATSIAVKVIGGFSAVAKGSLADQPEIGQRI